MASGQDQFHPGSFININVWDITYKVRRLVLLTFLERGGRIVRTARVLTYRLASPRTYKPDMGRPHPCAVTGVRQPRYKRNLHMFSTYTKVNRKEQ
jgi:hypothetical protein